MFRTKVISSLIINSIKITSNHNAVIVRNLYAPASLGIDGFLMARERVKLQINNVDSFKLKMQEFAADETSKNLIFTEDLKNMLHLSEKGDLELLAKMVHKFCSQSKDVRFGNYVFGPPVLRLFHHLKETDQALALFKDESLQGFFDQLISYQIILDLLYESKRYQDVLDTYEVIKKRQVQGARFPKHVLTLTLGACYKLNTPASLEFGMQLMKDASAAGHIPMRKAVTFLAALAINQGAAPVALELVTAVRQQSYLTIRTIKALAFSALQRYDDVLAILRSVLEVDNPMANKQTFSVDVIAQLKKDFENVKNKDLVADFNKTVGFLEKHGHISETTLDETLCAEIKETVPLNREGDLRYPQDNSFENNYQRRDNNYQRRGNDYQRRDDRDHRVDNRRPYQTRREFEENRISRPGLHELN